MKLKLKIFILPLLLLTFCLLFFYIFTNILFVRWLFFNIDYYFFNGSKYEEILSIISNKDFNDLIYINNNEIIFFERQQYKSNGYNQRNYLKKRSCFLDEEIYKQEKKFNYKNYILEKCKNKEYIDLIKKIKNYSMNFSKDLDYISFEPKSGILRIFESTYEYCINGCENETFYTKENCYTFLINSNLRINMYADFPGRCSGRLGL